MSLELPRIVNSLDKIYININILIKFNAIGETYMAGSFVERSPQRSSLPSPAHASPILVVRRSWLFADPG
jgi:hypothetical protein